MQELTKSVCELILSEKGKSIRIFDVSKQNTLGQTLVVCTGSATRQVRAIAEKVLQSIKSSYTLLPLGVEGRGVDQWVILDYGALIVHIFQPDQREYYDLDGLWSEAPVISLADIGITETEMVQEEDSSDDGAYGDYDQDGEKEGEIEYGEEAEENSLDAYLDFDPDAEIASGEEEYAYDENSEEGGEEGSEEGSYSDGEYDAYTDEEEDGDAEDDSGSSEY
jgi:ribosome-associated protein